MVAAPLSVLTVPAPVNAMSLSARSVTSPPLLVMAAATTMLSDASSTTGPAESIASLTVIVLWAERLTDAAESPTRPLTPPISTSPVLSIQRPPVVTTASRWLTLVWSAAVVLPIFVTAFRIAEPALMSPGPARSVMPCVASIVTTPLEAAVIAPIAASPSTVSVTPPVDAVAASTSRLPSDWMNMLPVPASACSDTDVRVPEGPTRKKLSAAPIPVPAFRLMVLAATFALSEAAPPNLLLIPLVAMSVTISPESMVPTVIAPAATLIVTLPPAVTLETVRAPETCCTSTLPWISAANDPTCMRSGPLVPKTPPAVLVTLNSPAALMAAETPVA